MIIILLGNEFIHCTSHEFNGIIYNACTLLLLSLQAPVVVDPKSLTEEIDLLSANDHLTHSEVHP